MPFGNAKMPKGKENDTMLREVDSRFEDLVTESSYIEVE